MGTETQSNKVTAIRYAERGWRVFPVHFLKPEGHCSCGDRDCKSPAKHPLTSDGCLSATTDIKQIDKWWTVNPTANIGIATGPESDLLVIDLDGEQGIEDFDRVQQEHEPLPAGPVSITGGGGRHILLKYPVDRTVSNAAKLHGTNVDVRGAGGYIVAAPSRHKNGSAYQWEGDSEAFDPPEAPLWLLDWIDSGRGNGESTNGKFIMTGDLDGPGVGEGKRHSKLVEFVGRHLAGGEGGAVVLEKARAWASRCEPPLDDVEVVQVVTDIEARHRSQEDRDEGDQQVDEKTKKTRSQAGLLVDMTEGVELFHDREGVAYATIEVADHRENWPVRSRPFKQWLARKFYESNGGAPGGQALADALAVLEGCALFDGEEEPVHLRVASDANDAHDGERATQSQIIIDLATPDWSVVVVTGDGWTVEPSSPVKFRRSKGGRPLPIPQRGGSVDLLKALLNIKDEDWPLIATWMHAAYRPQGPYPVLSLFGEAGSSKSTTSRLLRALVDPNEAPLRRQPRNDHDLVIAAHNAWVITLDNLSSIPIWLSDGLCRLSTGGGFSTRLLWANDEEQIFNATRPLIINGIEDLATRGDLMDRTVQINLEPIEEADRMPEAEYWAEVDRYLPQIFGAFLDAVSEALRNLPTTNLDNLPRMADFALWSVAGEKALGLKEGQFLDAYRTSQASANETVIEAAVIGSPILKLMDGKTSWEGTATELRKALEPLVDETTKSAKHWPQDARAVSNQLRRIAPNLRKQGVAVEFNRTGGRRTISFTWSVCKTPSLASLASLPQKTAVFDDADDANHSSSDANPSPLASPKNAKNKANDASDADDAKSPTQSNGGNIVMRF